VEDKGREEFERLYGGTDPERAWLEARETDGSGYTRGGRLSTDHPLARLVPRELNPGERERAAEAGLVARDSYLPGGARVLADPDREGGMVLVLGMLHMDCKHSVTLRDLQVIQNAVHAAIARGGPEVSVP
jgi:hypothetical protein